MKSLGTLNISDMRSVNSSAILELIRRDSPISRTAISRTLSVSLPTVMRIVDQLTDEGLIIPDENTEWSGGRPRSLVRFNGSGNIVVGIDLGGTNFTGAVADFGGNILKQQQISSHVTTGEESYRRLVDMLEELIAYARGLDGLRLRGIGVGAPGVTRHETGLVTHAPALDWYEFPLKQRLQAQFNLPIVIENDVNLAAMGEHWFGMDDYVRDMVVVMIGTGIGAGLIVDGILYRGAGEAAGEIGYMIPGREFLNKKYEGFGAFEGVASGTGIAARARELFAEDDEFGEDWTAEDVFNSARAGDERAKTIVNDTVDYIAMSLAGVSALLNPAVIVLGGGVAQSADLLLEPLRQRLDGLVPIVPQLVVSRLKDRAVVLGAVASILHLTSNYYVVRKLASY